MGSPDYRETFTHAARELDRFGLAYLHVMDGLAFGFHEQGEPMTLEDFREVFSGPLMGNCGYDAETAGAAVSRGAADMIAIGRPFISNPDLVERIANDWPLAPVAAPETWYSDDGPEHYTDYPNYAPTPGAGAEEES
jgi:2,4-dienoyl-CoA reductase-like NADH-dependent reductase (Old Yellow Enzyme family)